MAWRQTSRQRYVRRRPEQTPLYAIIAKHLKSWLAEHDAHGQPISRHVEAEFRRYLACGLLCFGFARARCGRCGQGFLVAFACKGRGVCPSLEHLLRYCARPAFALKRLSVVPGAGGRP